MSFCKNVVPVPTGTTFLNKCDAKSELKHEKYKRSSLKLAILMHIRNQFHRGQFFGSSPGRGYCFLKITTSAGWSFLGGRADCAGALGGDVRGVSDLQIEIGRIGFGSGFDTPCHAYGKGGGFN